MPEATATAKCRTGKEAMNDAWAKVGDLIKMVGFPIVVCLAVLYFMRETIMWERDTMVPVLQDTATALNKTAGVLERVEKKLEDHRP